MSNSTLVGESTAVIVAAKRTPISTRGGRLAAVTVDKLASAVISAVNSAVNSQVAVGASMGVATQVGGVFLGNCMGPGGNLARVSTLGAGLPVTVPAMTIDTQCGSSLTAIITAANAISAGQIPTGQVAIAGGAESASTAPARSVNGVEYARAAFAPAGFADPEMGEAAQALAVKNQISRELQDAYAVRSQDRASAFNASGGFAHELAPLPELTSDDAPRADMAKMIARFPGLYPDQAPADLAVTAGNSSRNSDGAAAVAMLANASRAAGQPGLAIIGSVTTGVDPALPKRSAGNAKARIILPDYG